MGVDANIITAERIKEEVRAGRTIDGAIQIGSKNSFWAIFDGNITVIIVAVVLMGVFGPPDGFWGTILKPVLMWFPGGYHRIHLLLRLYPLCGNYLQLRHGRDRVPADAEIHFPLQILAQTLAVGR